MTDSKPFRIAVRKFGPFESAMAKLWAAFCKETNCTVPVEMVPMDLHPLYDALLTNKGLANGDWDIAHISTDWIYEAYTAGAIENLNPFIQQNPPEDFPEGWSESLLLMQQHNRNIYAFPFHDGPECLIYRKDLFDDETEKQRFYEKFGKALTPPETWFDFYEIAAFFQRSEQNLYGTAFAGFPDGHNTVFDFCLQLWSRKGELTDENGSININTEAALEGLHFYKKIFKDHKATHPGSKDFDSVKAGLAFARGEVAMMVNWFGFAAMCEVIEESKVKGKVDITFIPKGINGASASLNVYWLYAIGAGSTNKQLAYDFLRFAINKQNDRLLTLEGGIGCRISTWHDAEVNNIVPYYHKLEMLHNCAKSLPLKSNWAKIAAIIDEVVLHALNTNTPIKELLTAGQQQIDLLDKN